MSLLSVFRKKQEPSGTGSDFRSRSDEEKPARKRRQGAKRDEAVDPVLPEKKRARRRLIGAIALVLAAVIGLPMILDSSPKPLSSDIAIQIPSKDAVAPLAPDAAPPAQPAVSAPAAAGGETKPASAKPSAPSPAQAAAQPEAKTPAAASRHEAPPAPPPAAPSATATAKTSAQPDTGTHPATKTKSADAARALAILEGKSPSAAPAASGKVAVQVAALASREKADALQRRLKGAGLHAYTEKVATSSGSWIRVRLGPFASEAEAEKARARLIKLGLQGKLVPA